MSDRTGYVIAIAEGSSFYIPDALHIERDDDSFIFEDDTQAARAVEQDGVQLIYGMKHVPDGVYVDTPENRAIIEKNLDAYPAYKLVTNTLRDNSHEMQF